MSVRTTTYEELRTLLVSGELRPGDRLAELPLAAQLGVSRPTIREVLCRLESHGLAASDGRSLRVAQLDGAEQRSALLMRSALEGLHAERAATRVREGEIAPAELRRLAELAMRAESATGEGRFAEAVEANRAFHQAVDALADSPISREAVDRLWDRIIVSTARSLAEPRRRAVVALEHQELLDALGSGDGARAGEVARRHVLGTLEASLLGLGDESGDDLAGRRAVPDQPG